MLKIVVLVSGGGTNLQAIIDAVENGTIKNVSIEAVISNNAGAYALTRATKHGIAAECISPKSYETREIFNEELLNGVAKYNPDLIVLAGFLVAIPPAMREPEKCALLLFIKRYKSFDEIQRIGKTRFLSTYATLMKHSSPLHASIAFL